MLNKINEAIQIGISIMDKYFQKLDGKAVANEEDDEDEDGDDDLVIYEAKDPYILRSLPFLIGSPLYLENDHVGLRDDFDDEKEINDEEEDEEDEEDEVEDKESEKGASSDSSTDDDDEETRNETKKDIFNNKNKNSEDDDDDDNLFKVNKNEVIKTVVY